MFILIMDLVAMLLCIVVIIFAIRAPLNQATEELFYMVAGMYFLAFVIPPFVTPVTAPDYHVLIIAVSSFSVSLVYAIRGAEAGNIV